MPCPAFFTAAPVNVALYPIVFAAVVITVVVVVHCVVVIIVPEAIMLVMDESDIMLLDISADIIAGSVAPAMLVVAVIVPGTVVVEAP